MDKTAKLLLRELDRRLGPAFTETKRRLADARRAHFLAALRFLPRHVPNGKTLRYAECRAMLEPASAPKEAFLSAAHAELVARLARLQLEAVYWWNRSVILRDSVERGTATAADEIRSEYAGHRADRARAEAGVLSTSASLAIYRRMNAEGARHG